MRRFFLLFLAGIILLFSGGIVAAASVCDATKYRKAGNVGVRFQDAGNEILANGTRLAKAPNPGWEKSAADWLRQAFPGGVHPNLNAAWGSELSGPSRIFSGDTGYVEVYYGKITEDIDPGNGLKKGSVRLWLIFRDWDAKERRYTIYAGLGLCPNMNTARRIFGP